MHKGVALSASLMCFDWLNAGAQLRILEEEGVDYLHFDIIDGKFVPDFTMGTSIIDVFRANTTLPSDYHLMVDEPGRLGNTFGVKPGEIYTIHQECCHDLHRELVTLRKRGVKAGVALSPATPLEVLEYVIHNVDVVMLMMVDPGYKGQPLVPQVLSKVEKLRRWLKELKLDVRISVDGHVNPSTIPEVVAAGADILVLGSTGLFRRDVPLARALAEIREAIDKGIAQRERAAA